MLLVLIILRFSMFVFKTFSFFLSIFSHPVNVVFVMMFDVYTSWFYWNENKQQIRMSHAYTDYHVVGCGDRTVSMWDHRNGSLLIDIEIELPTIGQNIGCYTVGDDVSTHTNTHAYSFHLPQRLVRYFLGLAIFYWFAFDLIWKSVIQFDHSRTVFGSLRIEFFFIRA